MVGEYKADGTPIRTYGYLPGSPTPLFLKENGVYYWYRSDRLGVPQVLVDTNGAVVWSAVYDAFGNVEIKNNTVANNLRFPGQYYDAETGLYYNLNRYYDPKTGRYLQTDPAGDGLNPYLYAAANPVNAIDPNGLCALRMFGGGTEMYFGAGLLGAGPAGWIVGSLMVLNGADNLYAGGRSALTGEYEQAFLEAGIHHYVQNETAANLLYMGTQLGLGYAGVRVHRAAHEAQVALAREALSHIPSSEQYKYLEDWANTADVSTKVNGTGFWATSSSKLNNMKLSQFFARITGKATLEMTAGGKYLDSLKLFDIWENKAQAAKIWDILSRRFAAQARGNVYVVRFFAKPIGPYGLRTWWRSEQPILLKRQAAGMVNKIRQFRIPFID